MKGLIVVLCLALICSFTAGASLRSSYGAVDTNKTLEELLNTQFGEFATALRVRLPNVWSEIVTAPAGTGAFTVFAPQNTKVGNLTSAEVLEYHITRGDVVAANIHQYTTVPTLYNATGLNNNSQVLAFTIFNNTVRINGEVNVQQADLIATNGVIHNISGVLSLPGSNVGQVLGDNYSTLTSLLKRTNISLAEVRNVAILAPTDAAFNKLFTEAPILKSYILGTNSVGTIRFITNLLLAHVVDRAFYPTSITNGSNPFTSLAKSPVEVFKNGVTGAVTILTTAGGVAQANVVQPNMLGSNGVVHGIDSVLSYGVGLDLRQTLEALNATTFISLLNSTGLGNLVLEDSLHTFFVPTNDALKGLKNVNASLIEYHVAQVTNAPFSNIYIPSLLNLTSLNGQAQQLYVSTHRANGSNSSYALVNNIRVSAPQKTLKGTYVYLIDTPLSKPASIATALKNDNFTDLVGLLSEKQINTTGLYNLNAPRTTVFAPTTEAFNKLPIGIVGFLRLTTGDSPAVAQSILNNHIVPNTTIYRFADGVQTFRSAKNQTLNVTRTALGSVTVNGNIAVNPVGVLTENGIAYPVDGVILPPGLEFNSYDILRGLPADGHDSQYGNYSTTIRHVRNTGFIDLLVSNASYIFFPPTNQAWESATETFDDSKNATVQDLERLRTILNLHIVYGTEDIKYVNNTVILVPGHLSNTTLELITNGNQSSEVQLRGVNNTMLGEAKVVVSTTSTYGQKIFGLDRVLGVGVETKKHHGLTTLEWILIGVGGAVLGLIILLIVAGAAYYLLVRPGRDGYRQIN